MFIQNYKLKIEVIKDQSTLVQIFEQSDVELQRDESQLFRNANADFDTILFSTHFFLLTRYEKVIQGDSILPRGQNT